MHTTDHLLYAAHVAVHRAATVTRAVQRELAAHHRLAKADDSPVTIADYAAQAVVTRALREVLGEVQPVLAEERSAYLRDPAHARTLLSAVNAARLVWPEATGGEFLSAIDQGVIDHDAPAHGRAPWPDAYWTLDPIDGTRGFIRGHQYSVCLARVERARVIIAVLGCPNLSADFARPFDDPDPVGLTVLAVAGEPPMQSPCDEHPDRTRLSPLVHAPARERHAPLRLCGSYSATRASDSAASRVIERLTAAGVPVAPPVRIDSQVKYAVVARAQMDAFLRMPRTKDHEESVWDHAPGALVAQSAGVTVTDCLGQPLNFAGGAALAGNRGLLVARPDVHALLLPHVRSVVGGS